MEAALSEEDLYESAEALSLLLDHLSGATKTDAMKRVLALVRKMENVKENEKLRSLSRLVDHIDAAPMDVRMGVLKEALKIEDDGARAEVLGQLAVHLPDDRQGEVFGNALEAARKLQYALPRVETLVNLARHHTSRESAGRILSEALVATSEVDHPIYVGDEQAHCYRDIVSSWQKINFYGLEDFRDTWQDTTRSLGNHRRWQFLLELGVLVELINHLGGSSAMAETYVAVGVQSQTSRV